MIWHFMTLKQNPPNKKIRGQTKPLTIKYDNNIPLYIHTHTVLHVKINRISLLVEKQNRLRR